MRRWIGTLVVWLATCAVAWAQASPNGSLRGYARDEQKAALPGVTVTATSPSVAGARTVTTDDEGFYRLLDLPPGQYEIVAELPGFSRSVRQGVVLRAGLNLALDLTLQVGQVSETVRVQAESPMLESTSAGQAVNVRGDLQRSLPLSTRRNFADFMELTPGTVTLSASDPQPRASSVYVNGVNTSFAMQLDGADIAPGVQSSLVYTSISSEVIQDVQVKTGGIDPSAPLGDGAAISIVTKSGTNQLKGSMQIAGQARSWSANNNPTGTTTSFSIWQPEGNLGGPVLRDRSWFFGSYRYTNIEQGISRTAAQLAALQVLSPGWKPLDLATTNHQSFVKSTTMISPHHRVEAFYQYGRDRTDRTLADSDGRYAVAPIGGASSAARLYSVLSDGLTAQIGVSYTNQNNEVEMLRPDTPVRYVYQTSTLAAGRRTGQTELGFFDGYPVGQKFPNDKLTVTADFEQYYRARSGGSHTIKFGVYLNPLRKYQLDLSYPADGLSVIDTVLVDRTDPSKGTMPFHRQIYDVTSLTTTNTRTQDYAAYAQDEWRPNGRLTINGGVRVDYITRRDLTFDAITQRTTAIGPRAGFNYRLNAAGTQSLHASWTRVHDSPSTGAGVTVGTTNAGYRDEYDLDLDGTFETTLITPGATQLALSKQIDVDHYRQPRADEALVGYQLQLPGRIIVDANYRRRDYRDQPAQIEINGIYDGGVFRGYRDETQNAISLQTSNVWNWPVYQSVQLGFVKDASRVQIIANYTRQFQHMAGTWQPNDPASFIQPDAFATDRAVDSPSVTSPANSLSGGLNYGQWRDHLLRAAVSIIAPWGMRLAANASYQAGSWSGPIVLQLPASDPAFGPPTVTLSNGRVVSNPLATTIRFAYPTRGDGQFRSDPLTEVNLRVSRETRFRQARVELGVDVLNLLNSGADKGFMTGANQQWSPFYGPDSPGVSRQAPRMLQLSLRASF